MKSYFPVIWKTARFIWTFMPLKRGWDSINRPSQNLNVTEITTFSINFKIHQICQEMRLAFRKTLLGIGKNFIYFSWFENRGSKSAPLRFREFLLSSSEKNIIFVKFGGLFLLLDCYLGQKKIWTHNQVKWLNYIMEKNKFLQNKLD